MTSVQGSNNLRKDPPHELLFSVLAGSFQVLDDGSQVTTTAILHVDVEVLAVLQMFSMEVADYVGMLKG